MNFRAHSTLYFATGLCFIALETIGATWPEIIVKAFIIPMLIWLYASHTKESMNPFHRMIIIALMFSWAGDVLLQFSQFNETYFLVGVGSFLVTQLIYMGAFFGTRGPNVIFFRKVYLILPVAAYGFLILWYIYDGLGDMLIPISIYAVVILTLLVAAMNRQEKVNRQSFILVLIAAGCLKQFNIKFR